MDDNKISGRVEENKVRAIAFLVVIISAFAAIFRQPVIMLLLSIDFMIRSFINSRYSLLAIISQKFLAPVLPFRNKMILIRPKKFAASIGMVLSAAAGLTGLAGQTAVMLYITGILLLFSFLETFLKFCAGCWMFGVLIRFHLVKEDSCPDCTSTTSD